MDPLMTSSVGNRSDVAGIYGDLITPPPGSPLLLTHAGSGPFVYDRETLSEEELRFGDENPVTSSTPTASHTDTSPSSRTTTSLRTTTPRELEESSEEGSVIVTTSSQTAAKPQISPPEAIKSLSEEEEDEEEEDGDDDDDDDDDGDDVGDDGDDGDDDDDDGDDGDDGDDDDDGGEGEQGASDEHWYTTNWVYDYHRQNSDNYTDCNHGEGQRRERELDTVRKENFSLTNRSVCYM
ncbi:hypothetical protein EPR50_G00132330 [Perca flavescens]|uniref:Uncharacterized protein n=1 Tax=Perca flavescens TaxID=8167 RepID=A0A484CRE8_PERFV|nr:hypothetical protein EPR50_G00132330 [Perca flavescens]